MEFGDRVRHLRERNNMTQEELANAIGLHTKAAVSKIEKGIVNPNQSTIWKLSVALNVSPSAFFYDEEITLTDHEEKIIKSYRKLSAESRNLIDRMLGLEKNSSEEHCSLKEA